MVRDSTKNGNPQMFMHTIEPFQHWKAGLVERFIRDLCERTREILIKATVSLFLSGAKVEKLWDLAIVYACEIINHLPCSALGGLTPHEKRCELDAVYARRVQKRELVAPFGSLVVALPVQEKIRPKRSRFTPRAECGFCVGLYGSDHIWLLSMEVVQKLEAGFLTSLKKSHIVLRKTFHIFDVDA